MPVVAVLAWATDAAGGAALAAVTPAALSAGSTLVLQTAFPEPAAPKGVVLSNGLRLDVP